MGGRKRRDVGGGRVGGGGKLRERWKLGAAHTGVCGGGVAPSAKGGAAGCVGPSRRLPSSRCGCERRGGCESQRGRTGWGARARPAGTGGRPVFFTLMPPSSPPPSPPFHPPLPPPSPPSRKESRRSRPAGRHCSQLPCRVGRSQPGLRLAGGGGARGAMGAAAVAAVGVGPAGRRERRTLPCRAGRARPAGLPAWAAFRSGDVGGGAGGTGWRGGGLGGGGKGCGAGGGAAEGGGGATAGAAASGGG